MLPNHADSEYVTGVELKASLMRSQELIKETENLLEKWKHPDPYRPPTAPGGEENTLINITSC
jgi:hypothetical protein